MRGPRSILSVGALALAVVASLATSAPRQVRRYPGWRVERQEHVVEGAVVNVWVSRSGREGIGVSVEMDPRGTGLRLEIDREQSELRVAGGPPLRPRRVTPAPAPRDRLRQYLPFRFDGLAAWNRGRRDAVLRLALRTPGAIRTLVVPMTHALDSPHTTEARP